jgi:hypothetical protein
MEKREQIVWEVCPMALHSDRVGPIIYFERIRICVLKNDAIPLPLGHKKAFLERTLPSNVASLDQRLAHGLTSGCRDTSCEY